MSMIEELKSLWKRYGQEHIFKYFDELSSSERDTLISQAKVLFDYSFFFFVLI